MADHTYDGDEIDLVFTTPTGGLVLRQTIAELIKGAAKTCGIDADLGTHAGRRTVLTILPTHLPSSSDHDGHAQPRPVARLPTERYGAIGRP